MCIYCLTKEYAHNRHRNDYFLSNSKLWEMKFCAWWVQLRVCKLRHQKFTMPCTTYFGLIKKYLKFAPVGYFKVGSYLQKWPICSKKSMVMAHQRTWVFKSLSLEFIRQPIVGKMFFSLIFFHFFRKADDTNSFFSHKLVLLELWNIYWHL